MKGSFDVGRNTPSRGTRNLLSESSSVPAWNDRTWSELSVYPPLYLASVYSPNDVSLTENVF